MSKGVSAQVIVADYAQVAEGKLTIVGGGFQVFNVGSIPPAVTFGVGIIVHVPWSETNRKHTWSLRLVDGDGRAVAAPNGEAIRFDGEMEVGRPAGHPEGTELIAMQAFNFAGLPVNLDTTYVAQFFIDGASNPIASAQFHTRPAQGIRAA